jgi:hypothetical protein
MNTQPEPESDGTDGTAPERAGTQDAVGAGTDTRITDAAETSVEITDGSEAGAVRTDAEAEAPEPARPETGEPRVDAALTLLDRLADLPVTEHAAVFEQVHAELTTVLGQLDPESAGTDG